MIQHQELARQNLLVEEIFRQCQICSGVTSGQTFSEKMTHGHFDVPDPLSPNPKFELILTVGC